MSISQLNAQQRTSSAYGVSAVRANTAAAAPSAAAAARQPDSVDLSQAARSLSAARSAVAAAPAVREDRVAAIRAAIADGTYSVDARQLARALASAI